MIDTAHQRQTASMAAKIVLIYDKIIFLNHVCHCGGVVKVLLARADNPVRLPATLFFVSLYQFFVFLFGHFFFNPFFFLLGFFSLFLLLTLLAMHLAQYIF